VAVARCNLHKEAFNHLLDSVYACYVTKCIHVSLNPGTFILRPNFGGLGYRVRQSIKAKHLSGVCKQWNGLLDSWNGIFESSFSKE